MPLKLKWGKKSGRYDLSQDIYVLTIYIGEYAILQSTLSTESTAEQCMEYLSQKVDLNQVYFFVLSQFYSLFSINFLGLFEKTVHRKMFLRLKCLVYDIK